MICLPEMEMMRHKAFNQLDDFIREHEKSKMQLEAQKQQLMQQELELRKRETLNESEKRKIQLQKEMVKKWHTENYLFFFFAGDASKKGKVEMILFGSLRYCSCSF